MMIEKFDVLGMSCAACQAHVTRAVKDCKGVKEVNVNLLNNNMVVDYDENICNQKDIINSVRNAGYDAILKSKKDKKETSKDYSLAKLIISGILLLILMYFSMGNMMWDWPTPSFVDHHKNPLNWTILQLILTTPIIIINFHYFTSGFSKLFKGHPNMDTLIAVGSSFSLLYSLFAMIMIIYGHIEYHMFLYFESAAMILFFVSIGKFLENISKKKTTKAIERLIDLSPKSATILIDNKEVEVSIEDVKVDDIVIVKKGEAIPVDGIIIEGNSSIDQSHITGESLPVYKTKKDEVYSSTILTSGYIKIKATKVGDDTNFATIIKLVEEASNSKAPISKLADKISAIFVPTILIFATIVFILNLIYINVAKPSYVLNSFETALNFAITVIVIACPCALGLATPVAIMVGTGKGAENGLLIKNAEILEKTHNIKTIVFDKTGTITKGQPEVTYIDISNEILNIIYSIELKSEHPLALAITKYLESKNISKVDITEYKSVDGIGLFATYNSDNFAIGNKNITNNIDTKYINKMNELSTSGQTPLLVSKNDEAIGIISVKDPLKENSKEAIAELKKEGIKVVLLTGDNNIVANAIAKEVGFDEVISEVKPNEKLNIINSLKTDDTHLVAMVGDGVNDAPALIASDIGIAIGSGTDIAIESSDIILQRSDILDVINAIKLSKRTLLSIKLGLFWAFFYNIICVILATGIFYYLSNGSFKMEPMYGSIAMSISSVSVVLNALSINLFKIKHTKIELGKEVLKMEQIVINVNGMMCNHCVMHVEKACLSVDGVTKAKASLENNTVTVTGNNLDKLLLIKAIQDAGYTAE